MSVRDWIIGIIGLAVLWGAVFGLGYLARPDYVNPCYHPDPELMRKCDEYYEQKQEQALHDEYNRMRADYAPERYP